MLSWEIHSEAMWYSGVKHPVSFAQAAIIAYMAITSRAILIGAVVGVLGHVGFGGKWCGEPPPLRPT